MHGTLETRGGFKLLMVDGQPHEVRDLPAEHLEIERDGYAYTYRPALQAGRYTLRAYRKL